MNRVVAISIFAIVIVASAGFFVAGNSAVKSTEKQVALSCYVGVTFCGNTTAEGKMLVDKVKLYTNLFIVDSIVINKNESALTDLCNYAVSAGLHLIVYFGDFTLGWQLPWIVATKQRLGDWFIGVYYYDEPGGIQLNFDWANSSTHFVPNYANSSRNYALAAASFISSFRNYPNFKALKETGIPMFTSDYALYWFDYEAGWDVVLTQFGWNASIAEDIALTRGAAQMENKSWGAIITWKYDQPPYLDTGDEIYSQMLLAYESGAKYICIFNSPTYPAGNIYGVMTNQQFAALERFWDHITSTTAVKNDPNYRTAEVAIVLPGDYGFGMSTTNERIWGFWGPDAISPVILNITQVLLAKYSFRLDIVYDDAAFPVACRYSEIYYWNQTVYG